MGSPFHLINFSQRAILGIVLLCSFWASSLFGDKVTESVIVASIEGEVSALNLIDDFKVNMSSSYVGKKISSKTILSTGKTGKVSLLFSNGTLITVKPGSRFYLRKYKQLEAVVEDLVPPGKLEEEPTKSELSAHLDFGDLIVKAPKLKKGSSMNLSSPIGTAGIRGTMFQFMAVRNPVTGDIMGGINLVSGDIEFTDTDGNTVTILSGQSIQLATSKLGQSVASQTGELVDLSSTYGPALTEVGALPPPLSSIFPSLNPGGDSGEESSDSDGFLDEPILVGSAPADLDFIHEIASELFFSIEEAEQVSSEFTFESLQFASPVEAPLPEVQTPSAPAAVTGETVAGGNIDRFMGVAPEINLRNISSSGASATDPLFYESSGGNRIIAEFRSPDEGLDWMDLDPGVNAKDFLDNNIENIVAVSNIPNLVLQNPETAELDAPPVGESVFYNVVYQVTDFRNSSSTITREVEVKATRPSITTIPALPNNFEYYDPEGVFEDWIDGIKVFDVRGTQLTRGESLAYAPGAKVGSYYLDPLPSVQTIEETGTSFKIVAKDWRGLISESEPFLFKVTATPPTISYPELAERYPYTDPNGLFDAWINQIVATDVRDENMTRGSPLLYNSSNSQNGFFYLAPFPDINDISENETTEFNIVAKDWRGIVSKSDTLKLKVTARPPDFEIKSENLYVELSDQPLSSIEHNITGTDEFNRTIDQAFITLDSIKNEPFTPQSRIDSLVPDRNYTLTYKVQDIRGEVTEVNRTLWVYVTSPNFNGVTFKSNASWIDANSTLEYLDPLEELSGWISQQGANGLNGIDISSSIISEVDNDNYRNWNESSYKNLPVGQHQIKFTATDPRLNEEITHPDWHDRLRVSYTATLWIIATPPTFVGIPFKSDAPWFSDGNETLEYTDLYGEGELLPWIESQSATDPMGEPIDIVASINSYSGGDNPSFNSPYKDLPIGEYIINFSATDSRYVASNSNSPSKQDLTTEFNASLSIVATPPTFVLNPFESNALWITENETVEYTDPDEEIEDWVLSQSATDPLDRNITIIPTIVGYSGGNIPSFNSPYKDLPIGEYIINFSATDSRYNAGNPKSPSKQALTKEYNASLIVKATPPKLEIYSSNWRSGLAFDPSDEIEYLVKPRSEYLAFDDSADDGEFTFRYYDVDLDVRDKPTTILKATAYDGTDISDKITVDGQPFSSNDQSFGVNYESSPDDEFSLEVKIDDKSYRKQGLSFDPTGETNATSIKIKIVDRLGPFLKLPPEFQSSEIYTLAGSRNQALPIPRLEIIDNYYERDSVESASNIFVDDGNYTSYPDFFLEFDETPGIGVGGVLGFSGYYENFLTFDAEAIKDVSGNYGRNEEINNEEIKVSLDLNITDSESPTIQLISGSTYYVDLSVTTNFLENNLPDYTPNLSTDSVFEDPGVQITENLFVHEPGESSVQLSSGRVIGDLIETLEKKDERYSVKVQAYDKDDNYTLIPEELSTTIVDILEDYNHTRDSDKYRVTYTFTDRASNAASVSRDFEFTNDPNAPSVVSFTVLDSAKVFLEGENSIYQTEVSSDETALVEPLVSAYYAVSSGNVYVGVEKQAYLLTGSDENSTSDADLAKYNKVNYHKNSSGQEFYVDLVDGNLTQKSNSYPKNIVSYSAKNQFGREYIYDLEIRVQDTTPPDFVLSQNPNLNLEVGQPYNDFNHSDLEDNYDTSPSLTRTIIYDGAAYYGPNGTEPYDHFSQEGFWESGVYQITYSAKDDFDNEQNKTRTITISDTTPPHMALVSYEGVVETYPSSDEWAENPTLTVPSALTIPTKLTDLNTTAPYVKQGESENDFILKHTEANASLRDPSIGLNESAQPGSVLVLSQFSSDYSGASSQFKHVKDQYNRSHIWYSAFTLDNNGEYFRDPGIYLYSTSAESISVSSRIKNIQRHDETGDLISFVLEYNASDAGDNSNQIVSARQFTFVDEVSPVITLLPEDNNISQNLIVVEAGSDFNDSEPENYKKLWDFQTDSEIGGFTLFTTSAWDARDGTLTDSIQRTVHYLDNNGDIEGEDLGSNFLILRAYLNQRIKVDYRVSDSDNNLATAQRFYIVKDTTSPIISIVTNPDGSENSEYISTQNSVLIDYNTSKYKNDDSNFTAIKSELLKYVQASDYADQNLDPVTDRDKWDINITKPGMTVDTGYEPGVVYPSQQTNYPEAGYRVDISVRDSSGNGSEIKTLYLKVGDATSPTFVMIGDPVIHDFLRYGSRTDADINNTQKLFPDRSEVAEFNGTGYSAGAHRFMLADYNFIDPGIYAEDASFGLDDYADFDGDGTGEAHARQRVSNFPSYPTPGIIYYKSFLETKTLREIEQELASFSPIESKSSYVDENGTNVSNTTILKFTIEYRVSDGWSNIADTNRTVYIYESHWNDPGKATYATPLQTPTGTAFKDLHHLSVTETDYDGDGISDFWEIALGSRFDDASSIPVQDPDDPSSAAFNFADPSSFRLSAQKISEISARIQLLRNNPEFATALEGVTNFIEFQTNPSP